MNFFKIILQLAFLYAFYLLGVFIQTIGHLSVPGSMIGMLLLFGALQFNVVKREYFSLAGSVLLKQLPLFLIPATVGVIDYLDLFKGVGIITIGITLLSTVIVMIISTCICEFLLTRDEEVSKDKEFQL